MSKDATKIQQEVQELRNDYNAKLDVLRGIQTDLYKIKDDNFTLLRTIYQQMRNSSPSTYSALSDLEKKYEINEADITTRQKAYHEKMEECFLLLQKLNSSEQSFLVGLVNGYIKERDELTKELEGLKKANQKPDNL
jgi:DNA-binding transcriptional regulator GbsR (MarR family)